MADGSDDSDFTEFNKSKFREKSWTLNELTERYQGPAHSGCVIVDTNANYNIPRSFNSLSQDDEMFSDSYPIKLVDGVLYEVTGKYVSRKAGEIVLTGANPSAEEADEGSEEATESGCDIVLAHQLVECFAFGDKKGYTQYLKDYMKRLVAKLEETSPSEVDTFKSNMSKVMKDLLGRFKDLQFFTGSQMDVDGMVALMEYRDINGESKPIMMFFKHGLIPEKF